MSSEHRATGADGAQHGHRPEDERCVDALLAEGGYTDDPRLRRVLLKLRELRVTDVPPPSAELHALMGGPGTATVTVLEPGKQPKKKRVAFTTLAVAASLGIASGAAAASEEIRRGAEGTIMTIVRAFSAPAPAAPAPAPPSGEPGSAPAVAGDPAAENRSVPYPAGPPPAADPASVSGVPVSGQEPSAEKPPGRATEAAKASPDDAAGAAAAVPAGANPGAETPGPALNGAPPGPAPVNSTEPHDERAISRANPDGKEPAQPIEQPEKQGTRR